MPDPNTHTAAGIAVGYTVGKAIGLNPDYLVIGMVGALIAAARQAPDFLIADGLTWKFSQTVKGLANLSGACFFAATITAILVVTVPIVEPVAIPIAGLTGFFGQPLIISCTEFISRAWKIGLNKLGGGE